MTKRPVAILLVLVAVVTFTIAAPRAIPQDGARPPADVAKKGGGPGGRMGGGFGPGTFLAPPILEAADTDKDGRLSIAEATKAAEQFIRDADVDKKGSVDAETLGRAINGRLGPPPGGGPGPGGPPGGFGPGNFLAPQVVTLADADKDGRVSPEEAGKAAGSFIRDADADKKGSIDSDALAGAMNRRIGPPPGFGGPGGPMAAERKMVKEFDRDGNGWLDKDERQKARAVLKVDREKTAKAGGRGRPGFGPPGGFGGRDEPVKPGPRVDRAEVLRFPGKPLYAPDVVRTVFLDFEESDWEAAMADFRPTDVDVPAAMTVDGRMYPGVGVHFRGMSSYFMVGEGHKRSLNISVDFAHPEQRVEGYKTLNLLNSHEDPSFLHTVLYLQIARTYLPAPKANFVRLVVNGESWGLYVNAQQFDKTLIAEGFPGTGGKGARWKVRGNPGADGGLTYVGDDLAEYKKRYDLKTTDNPQDWKALIALCKTINETPPEGLEAALKPILDVEGVLRFLALDVALINGDGYWTRASDYSLYRDPSGKFHVLPHDANETFGPAMQFGPPGGFGGRPAGGAAGPRPSGVTLDPLIGLDDVRKPLRSRLLAVPALKRRYLEHVRAIATDWLDWAKLGPIVAGYRALIEKDVEADTRKLTSTAAFREVTADTASPGASTPRGPGSMGLRAFADQRRTYLLDHPAIKALPALIASRGSFDDGLMGVGGCLNG